MNTPEVLYEDAYLLAVNKPAGWVINDSATAHNNPILQSWIEENFKFPISKDRFLRNGIVHRLDKETSGIVLIAKTKEVFESLQKEFGMRKVKKTYLALVHGKMKAKEGTIDAPVGRLPWNRMRFGVFEGGRPAVTKYQVTKSNNDFSLLTLKPETGRTHQLRVHLKHIGHPVVSDPLYVGRKTLRIDRKRWPRLWLHAKSIEFVHPVTKKDVQIDAPLPEDLKLPYTE